MTSGIEAPGSAVDLLIRGGRIVDGTGGPWYRGDLAINHGRIVAMGPSLRLAASDVLAAGDLLVSPGFIDLHAHADLGLLVDGAWPSAIAQGVTTILIGQDGLGLAPLDDATRALRRQLRGINGDPDLVDWSWRTFDEYLQRLDAASLGPNVASMVSHGTVRMNVMGESMGTPDPTQLGEMRSLVADAMRAGAFGLSAGLTYPPATFASDAELVELCRTIGPYGGFYQPHHRNYGDRAILEFAASIDIGRLAGVPVHLTHAHLSFPVNVDRAPELLELVDSARRAGIDVTLDSYPYLAGSTYLAAFLPSWSAVGGTETVLARLADTSTRARIGAEMDDGCDG
jgi:N-acyl-D-amino-acid deacylase